MVDGKAELMREDFCDGFGDCLPACPADAIHIEEREAPAYDESAVKAARAAEKPHICPGSAAKALRREEAATASAPAPPHWRKRFAPPPATPRSTSTHPSR